MSNGKTSRLTFALNFEATHPVWDMHAGYGTDATCERGSAEEPLR